MTKKLLHKGLKRIYAKSAAEIALSDFHTGSILGLFYPSSAFDHKANDWQKWLWKVWGNHILPGIDTILAKWKPEVVHTILVGDLGDIDYKLRSPGEYWTRNAGIVVENLAEILAPISKISDYMRFVWGTKSHIGDEGGIDEAIARNFSNTIWQSKDQAGYIRASYELAKVRIEAQHFGKGKSTVARTNLLNSLASQIVKARIHDGDKIPDMVWRGHNHWTGISDIEQKPLICQVPPFQLSPHYYYHMNPIGERPVIGARMTLYENGKITQRPTEELIFTYSGD